jgi:hypothetical protein
MSYRVEPHAARITHGQSGVGGTEKWPSIEMLLKVSQSGLWGWGQFFGQQAYDHLFHLSLRSSCAAMLAGSRTDGRGGRGDHPSFKTKFGPQYLR